MDAIIFLHYSGEESTLSHLHWLYILITDDVHKPDVYNIVGLGVFWYQP